MIPDVFNTVFMPMAPMLYRIAVNILGNGDDAQDAVQELYCKVLKEWRKVKDSRNPEGYCVRMLQNICRDMLQSGKRMPVVRDVKNACGDASIDSPESEAVRREDAAILRRAIGLLPEKYRRIVILRDIEQKEFDEIGRMTGMTPVNIRVALSRGRRMLKEMILNGI